MTKNHKLLAVTILSAAILPLSLHANPEPDPLVLKILQKQIAQMQVYVHSPAAQDPNNASFNRRVRDMMKPVIEQIPVGTRPEPFLGPPIKVTEPVKQPPTKEAQLQSKPSPSSGYSTSPYSGPSNKK